MKRITIAAVAIIAVASTALAFSGEGARQFRELLNGYKEAGVVVSTTGTGTFYATISKDETEINYELTFHDLQGDVRQSHIHIGHPQNSGGITLWLCQTAASKNPLAGNSTPDCSMNDPLDVHAGRVTGRLTAADVQAVAGTGIAAGEWEEVLGLIRAGRTYVNVHSSLFPPGEIRSQIDQGDDDSDDHGHKH
jgi:hypothetical protein